LGGASLLALVLVASASSAASSPSASQGSRSAPAQPATFLALGDSYTIGQSVTPEERWPERLVALLAGRGVALAPPRVIARTGWTTADLERASTITSGASPHCSGSP
jgi:hypothetical protein